MGYDLRITRNRDGTESNPISLEHWLAYVESDPELRLDGGAEVQLPDGNTLRYDNEGLAVWTAYSRQAWFDYRNGRVIVKNPDDAIIEKMKAVAEALDAMVIGDDGEQY